ncbi:MAG: hypothetical protein ACM31C_03865, partial [Acidobacteriota bacterium]
VHPYRRMMPFLMRGRNESAVYFEQQLDLSRTLPWLEQRQASLFSLVLHALASVLHERERLNRFTVKRKTYQRDGVLLSFAAKKKLDEEAPLATIKRRFDAGETFDQLVGALAGDIETARSGAPSQVDRELGILLKLPGFLLAFLIWLLDGLYARGLAPRSLVDTDPMYASAFVANLGSLQLDAAYHHLYEHGNCPLFVTIGRIHDGKVTLKFTFDERVEDGLYAAHALGLFARRIEDPASWIPTSA